MVRKFTVDGFDKYLATHPKIDSISAYYSLPSIVVQLATTVYNGNDCLFALHDAALEAGLSLTAAHLRDENLHFNNKCVVIRRLIGVDKIKNYFHFMEIDREIVSLYGYIEINPS